MNSNCLRTKGKDNTVGSLTEVQRSIVVGSLLGDDAMRCKVNALVEINHCLVQREYVDWKYRHLAEFVGTPPKARASNGSRLAYRFTTLSRPELTPFYRSFYEGPRKSVESMELTPLSMAVWFMDDGSKSHRALYLNTQQFDLESQLALRSMLKAQWNLDTDLNRDKSYFRLRMAVSSVDRFRAIVESHVLEMFRYKFPS